MIISCGCQSSSKRDNSQSEDKEKLNISSLENTKWQLKIADNCVNYFMFKESGNMIYYSCETEDRSYGTYFIKDDTLNIHEFITDSDSLLVSYETEHRSQEAKYKLVLIGNKLKHIERWTYTVSKKKWEKESIQFDDGFLFEKVK
jgi:hypothetical protein